MNKERIIRMAREAGINVEQGFLLRFAGVEDDLERFAAFVAAAERERFYGQVKPTECVNGCPANQICDYCQIVEPVKALIADEREACAKVLDEMANDMVREMEPTYAIEWVRNRAAFIRARGETK